MNLKHYIDPINYLMYANLFELDNSIQRGIAECLSYVTKIKNLEYSERKAHLECVKPKIKKLEDSMKIFRDNIAQSPPSMQRDLLQRDQEHQVWVDEVFRLLREAKSKVLLSHSFQESSEAARKLQKAMDVQDSALTSLSRSQSVVACAEESAILSLNELAHQKSTQACIDNEIDTLNINTRRVGKEIRWFTRNLVSDKLFMTMFSLTFLALLAVIGFRVYTSKQLTQIDKHEA